MIYCVFIIQIFKNKINNIFIRAYWFSKAVTLSSNCLAEKYHYPDEERKRPPVPRAKDAPPLMGIKTTKNFITTNAVENIMAVPKKPAANMADTRHGDTFPLEESGLVPKYRNKKVRKYYSLCLNIKTMDLFPLRTSAGTKFLSNFLGTHIYSWFSLLYLKTL